MKVVAVEDSVGMILCQDITRIVPGEFKGVLFKKGHIVTEADIPKLLDVGKEHLYVWEENEGDIHENEAALRIGKAVCGDNVSYDEEIKEGKCSLKAKVRGLLTIDTETLFKINSIEFITVATLPTNYTVEKDTKVCGARIVPLLISGSSVDKIENLAKNKEVVKVLPYKPLKCGIVTTGSEVFKGRIKDKFGPVMREKIQFYGGECLGQTICPDDKAEIEKAVKEYKDLGADLVILTGGMSVDPDDITPSAIKSVGAEVVSYGAPVQPGNMLMLAYDGDLALVGVPGCAMFFKTTALDTVLARVFAGVRLNKSDFARMGEGGLCLSCEECQYPKCYFCRG